jgi:Tol biopolymer transport system component
VDTYDIWVINLGDPFNPTNITRTPGIPEIQPSWSPLDDQIVYVRSDFIYKMNADGSNPVRLASPGKNMVLREPDWRRNQ